MEINKKSGINTEHIASLESYKGVTIVRITGSVTLANLTGEKIGLINISKV